MVRRYEEFFPPDAMIDSRTALFQWIADRYPTPAIARGGAMRAAWKTLFYLVGPQARFAMRTSDYRLWVDPKKRKDIARTILHRGQYEPIETAIMRRHLRPGMTMLDIGANIGHYAMVAAGAVGADGTVVAFEPEPENFTALQANLALNALAQARAENLALGAAEGELTLYRDEANRGGHSLAQGNVQRAGQGTRVRVSTLDAYAAAHLSASRVGFIKMDVQGAEAQVIAGARALLARDRPVLLMEFWPHGIRGMAGDPMALIAELLGLGYALQVIERDAPGNLRALPDLAALERIDLSHPQAYANLVFTALPNAGP